MMKNSDAKVKYKEDTMTRSNLHIIEVLESRYEMNGAEATFEQTNG